MSDNENKPRILRTSAGKTRLTAGSSDTGQSQSGATENKREASSAGGGQPAKPQQPAKSQQAGQTAQPKTTTQAQTPAKAGSGGQAGKPAGQQEQPVKAQPAKPAQAPAAGTDSASTSGSGKSGAGDSSATGTDASKANSSGVRSTSQGVRLGGSKSDAGQTQVVATSGGAGSAGSAGGGTGGVAGGRGSEAPTQQGSGPDTSRDRGGESQPSSQAQRGSAPTQVGGVGAVAGAGAGASAAGGAATSASANQSGSGPDHSNVAKTSGAKKSKDGVRASSAGVKMKGNKKSGPRSVNLTVASVDLWSVSKMTLLLSVALGIATIVAFIILWLVLQATGTLESIRGTMGEIAGPESAEEMLKLLGFGPVVSFAVILAVVNVVLMTALATLFGFLYNIGAKMVGGFRLTLVDD